MKKLLLSVSLLVGLACFNACSTDIELYADYKDIPVVYGLLDASQDTNYIRINRAFSGSNENPINANEVALVADSCNYPGKLRTYIVEYQAIYGNQYEETGEVIELDTMTVHDKHEGIFYSPDQKVYYARTKEIFSNNSPSKKYRYKLFVHKDNDTITAETNLVGGEEFKVINNSLSFKAKESDKSNQIKFVEAQNAEFYDMYFVFRYRESINNGPFVEKQVKHSFGSKSVDELGKDGTTFYVTYPENILFDLMTDAIGGDTVMDANHPNVVRYFDNKPITIYLAAGGDELYNYILVNSQSGYSQTVPDYTNVYGGYGVFSSRKNLVKEVDISALTKSDLYGKPWGFMQQ
ncbi:MAG: DUF4249 family protein [Bacteroidales bacterium]|nr:DUF4249 family protein [Bacteroidales bacterium]